jgi:4-amino-4-deoxy-L-arabinose transferase-like glycosyltransferase
MWTYLIALSKGKSHGFVLCGIILSIAVMTRPDSLVFIIVFAAVIGAWSFKHVTFRTSLAPMILGFAPLILWWTLLFYNATGRIGMSTFIGAYEATAVYNLWDRVGPKDRVLGQILSRHSHDRYIGQFVLDSIPDLEANSKNMPFVNRHPQLEHVDLMYYMGDVSRDLMRRCPWRWIDNSLHSFKGTFDFDLSFAAINSFESPRFTRTPCGPTIFNHRRLYPIFSSLFLWQKPVLVCMYLIEYLFVLNFLFSRASKRTACDVFVFAITLGMMSTLVTDCLVNHYYAGYCVMFYSVLVVSGVYAIQRLIPKALAGANSEPAIEPADGD